MGSIDVRPDSAGVYADVNVMDAYEETADWSGLWTATVGSHEIHLNNYFLQDYSLYNRQAVVEHEFGHALKSGHRNDRYTLMYCYDDSRVPNAPAQSDIAQYRSYWG
ncbi:hypothetical protein SAMN04487905_103348 [Actinopolyspora xinjiangensis]|uniref:Matrixin n=1 Tax=Actinopolyspora xinjiangensis TaxID=405564 RepID=A0A1H0S220_9ACTN|nr:hypothetical protein [Actinopolyspora xinjiangensis]SDP35891.1 hypothetical protein SAMN04487905_103348 [Actinopolyspora xinjiangensis]